MSILAGFIDNVYKFLITKVPDEDANLVKFHSKHLEEFGDISFPILLKNWTKLISTKDFKETDSIFNYKYGNISDVKGLLRIQTDLNDLVKIHAYKLTKNNAHLFLERPQFFRIVIKHAVGNGAYYGKCNLFSKRINCLYKKGIFINRNNVDLTTLRLLITKDAAENLVALTSIENQAGTFDVYFDDHHVAVDDSPVILCSPVIDENGTKNCKITASELLSKRSSDMRAMALHRSRFQSKSESDSDKYFSKLGMSCVILELLSNKLSKSVKITLNGRTNAEKDASFIFYNCARLSVLINEFQNRVQNNVYPELPAELTMIDFSLLKQPEEWKLLYVFIAQFPSLIKNSIQNIEQGNINLQSIVTYLLNLSLTFSVYYRRIKILIEPRDHLIELLHARIYLLMALQYVFHNALGILNIEPIKKM